MNFKNVILSSTSTVLLKLRRHLLLKKSIYYKTTDLNLC